MSTAHRPTWAPAIGKETGINTRQTSSRDVAGYTKLKFRTKNQGTPDEIKRRDLRLELARAEKRAKTGKDDVEPDAGPAAAAAASLTEDADEQVAKRRKLLQEAAELDKDDTDDEDGAAPTRARSRSAQPAAANDDDDDSDDDSEDETAELMRELEKIKRERAEEKERIERERLEKESVDRDEAIATGNPLMDLQSALSSRSSAAGSSVGGFAVKRRWDSDTVFKNQAQGTTEAPKGQFVNDLLRTEFHKRFIKRFVA